MGTKIYPIPQKHIKGNKTITLPENFVVLFKNDSDRKMFKIIKTFHDNLKSRTGLECYPVADYSGKLKVSIKFVKDETFTGEKYAIIITDAGITVKYGEYVAAYRAQESLVQLFEATGLVQDCDTYIDWPDITRRGFMLDVSRAKVPKLEKLFGIVDILSMLKMNEFQLYIETFVYEYPAYPEHAHNLDAYTPFELLQLSNYARDHYIDLVPNQNSFGHLHDWVQHPDFKHLRITDTDGCASINPIDPASLDLINNFYDSLLPCFYSDYINVGCDEVDGIKNGKTKELAEEIGALRVYINHIKNINESVRRHGRRAQFWGDVLLREADSPDVINEIPKDMIPLVWGYCGTESFDNDAALISSLGYDFYLCPGTSSWISMFPDLANANPNVLDAAECAVKYGARGVLMTDWGDFGHIQFDFTMQLGMIYSGALNWNLDGNRDFDLACEFADAKIYKSSTVSVSSLIRRGAELYDDDYFWIYHKAFTDNHNPKKKKKFNHEHYSRVKLGMISIAEDAEKIVSTAPDAEQLKEEIIWSAKLYEFMTDFMLLRLEYAENGKIENYEEKSAEFFARYENIKDNIKRLWNVRNKEKDNERMFKFMDKGFASMKETCENKENA